MTISINQVSSNTALLVDGNIYQVAEYHHVKPGKGCAFVRIKLRNLQTQQVIERTYKTADKLEDVQLEERKLQNLYQAGDNYHFMCNETFEELVVHKDIIGNGVIFLQDNLEVTGYVYNHQVLRVELPNFIITEITFTENGLKGDSTRAGTKPATIDTGATVQVPLFIENGDFIRLDTRTGQYCERVKK